MTIYKCEDRYFYILKDQKIVVRVLVKLWFFYMLKEKKYCESFATEEVRSVEWCGIDQICMNQDPDCS
jgi:hypothetical protein